LHKGRQKFKITINLIYLEMSLKTLSVVAF